MLQLKAIDPPVWERFEKAARRQRRNPYDLIREYMQQCLEAWEDQRLDEEIGKQARAGGKRAKDAVKVVRQGRRRKSRRRGNWRWEPGWPRRGWSTCMARRCRRLTRAAGIR